jgi:hypothetical protein
MSSPNHDLSIRTAVVHAPAIVLNGLVGACEEEVEFLENDTEVYTDEERAKMIAGYQSVAEQLGRKSLPTVKIKVEGGVADVVSKPRYIRVQIKDLDNLEEE